MAAPVVRDLQSTIQELRQGITPQIDLLNQDNANLDTSGAAQEAALDAKKNQAFQGITASANDRGALFSGFRPDAEATYTADTYLPALAGLRTAIQDSRRQIQGQKASLESGVFDKASGYVEGDKSAYQTWQDQQDQIAAQQAENEKQRAAAADEAEKSRAFTAQQNALQIQEQQKATAAAQAFQAAQAGLDRSASASLAAANRAAAANSQPGVDQALVSLFSKYDPNDTRSKNYTETVVLPTLAKAYGYDMNNAAQKKALQDIVYGYRKQFFGE